MSVGDLGNHALTYAGLGLAIFPVGHDKRPLHSQHDATTDLDQIEEWWERWPDALIGHRVAPTQLILDVDPRHGGLETWRALKADPRYNGAVPRAHYSGRGDGGGHIWFLRPDGELSVKALNEWAKVQGTGVELNFRWTAGIDLLRYEHRYTILPPSPHPETHKPYRWAPGKGLNVDPPRMPAFLAELLTRRDESTTRIPTTPTFRQADSIADWYSATRTWGEVLEPHGWQRVSGDGDSDGSEWRHPEATTSHSATIRHDQLFVYSTSTLFEPTEPDDPHGYTRFRAYAILSHRGDLSEAGRGARELKHSLNGSSSNTQLLPNRLEIPPGSSGTRERPGSQETALQRVDLEHLESFWTLTPQLGRIRDFARARRCSPWAMLGVVLSRVAAATPPFVVLPPLVGSHMSLNLYVCLVGGSGSGKDAAINAGTDALQPMGAIEFKQIGLGSGEGILDQYVEYKPADKQADQPAHFHQHTESVLFVNPEIETISALKGRSNSTLMSTLREAWMGSQLGFAYRSSEKRATLGKHHYRLCLIIGSQPTSAHTLLDEEAVGTPQRFVWLPVEDPAAPDRRPDEPPMFEWRLPEWPTAVNGLVTIEVCNEAIEAVDNARLARLRGDAGAEQNGHALACQEKLAILLALLHGSARMSLEYWSMAGIVQSASLRTQEQAQTAISEQQWRSNRARGKAEAERQVIVTEVVEDEAIQRVARRLGSKITSEWVKGSELRNILASRDRQYFEEAMERLVAAGGVDVDVDASQARKIIRYRRVSK